MRKCKSLFFALCLTVTSLCLFVACGLGGMQSGTEEDSSPSVGEVLPDDPPKGETPGEGESSKDSGIQFPEVPLP